MNRRPVGSIRDLGDGRLRVEVKHGYHPVTGKPRRLSEIVHGNYQDAEIVKARLLLEIGKTPQSDVTVRQYLEQMYLPHKRKHRRARTVDGYESIFTTHVYDTIGSAKLAELRAYQLTSWFDDVRGEPQTRLHVYRALCTALNVAVKWELIDFNPILAVESPVVETEYPDVLSQTEANAYLDAFAGHVLEPLIILALSAGLRRSELVGLTWADIDFDAGTVAVRRGLHDRKGGVIEEDPKSRTSRRTVNLPRWAIDALRPLRGLGPLVAENGAVMPPWRVSRLYVAHVASCGLRPIQLKNLRHSHACLMLDSGVDIYTVSRRLGHSTVSVTEKHYLRPGDEADKAAANAFDRVRRDAAGGEMRPNLVRQ